MKTKARIKAVLFLLLGGLFLIGLTWPFASRVSAIFFINFGFFGLLKTVKIKFKRKKKLSSWDKNTYGKISKNDPNIARI